MSFSAETIASLSGVALSLLFAYVPKLSDKFAAQTPTRKRLIMAGLLLLTTAGLVANGCRVEAACYQANVEQAITIFVAALVANQGAYLLAPRKR